MTDLDELDDRLKDYASRWRASLAERPSPEGITFVSMRSGTRRSHGWRALAAAVVVALAIGATVWATEIRHDTEHSPSKTPEGPVHPVPWEPLDPTNPVFDAAAAAAYSSLTATGNLALTAPAGGQVDFAVTLESPTRISLDPCPDFTISQQMSWDDFSDEPHALNCAAVPYKDSTGTPYLPAGQPVTFVMETMAPSVHPEKLTWHLDVPNGPPAISGSLKVTPSGTENPAGIGYCAALVFDGRGYELSEQQPGTGVGASLGTAQGQACGANGDHAVTAYAANEQAPEEALTVSYGDRVLTYAPEHSAELVPVPYPDVLDQASGDVRGSDLALVRRFAQLAVRPDPRYRDAVPFAHRVEIGLGADLRIFPADSLDEASSWTLDAGGFAGRTGPVNVLDPPRDHLLARLAPELPTKPDLRVSVGDRARCAGPALAVPKRLASLRHVTIEPEPSTIASCLDWFAIDLFVDSSGHVVAVSLDLWEP